MRLVIVCIITVGAALFLASWVAGLITGALVGQ